MATQGVLGRVKTIANQNQVVYTVPAGIVATATISIVNTGTQNATVRLYAAATDVPTVVDAIEYGAVVTPGGVLERSCMPLGQNEKVIVYSTQPDVVVRVSGFEASNEVE